MNEVCLFDGHILERSYFREREKRLGKAANRQWAQLTLLIPGSLPGPLSTSAAGSATTATEILTPWLVGTTVTACLWHSKGTNSHWTQASGP